MLWMYYLFTLLLHHQRFPLLMQITALGGDVERVLQLTHGETPWVWPYFLGRLGYLKNDRSDSWIRHFQNYRNNFKSYKYQTVVGYKYPTYSYFIGLCLRLTQSIFVVQKFGKVGYKTKTTLSYLRSEILFSHSFLEKKLIFQSESQKVKNF